MVQRGIVFAIFLAILLLATTLAQNVTSSINGVLTDQSGAAVPGASCILTSPEGGTRLKVMSESGGLFTFPTVAAGTYNLKANAAGFKSLSINKITVIASERHALGNLTLLVGDVQQSIEVTAEAAALQLASGERSGLVTGAQVNDLALKGRDYLPLMLTVPGVVDTVTSPDATSNTAGASVYINGARDNTKNITVDGITAMDSGSNNSLTFEPNMDSIAVVRVLASNYQAEYGRNAGGSIMAITKSGTRDFHGSAYDFYRNETLNANDFFNNRSGTARLPYRLPDHRLLAGRADQRSTHFQRREEQTVFLLVAGIHRPQAELWGDVRQHATALERSGISRTAST
jgi:Carboxypeptidase regulatory-like domain/TonB-dependent Receptor Plug Domain